MIPRWVIIVTTTAVLITTVSAAAVVLWRQVVAPARRLHSTAQVLDEIAVQFRTDSGSTLRDVVNRLEKASDENTVANRTLHSSVDLLTELLRRLDIQVTLNTATGVRIEKAADGVATDLAASQHRADAATGDPGAAADAGARSEDREQP